MLPPEFVSSIQVKGLRPPYCRECVHSCDEGGTARLICWKYGAYVLLSSSCRVFERRVGSSTPIVSDMEIKARFQFGLNVLSK